MTPANINFPPKKYAGGAGLACPLAGTPAQPRFAPLQEKKHQARRLGGPLT